MMKPNYLLLILTLLLAVFICACSTVPITGRSQLSLVPNEQILPMSLKNYDDFMAKNKKSTDKRTTALVKNVGQRIQHAVERYFGEQKLSHLLDGYQWEFNLVANSQINAWCMPGGKVVVYSGILPITKDENGLAVVIGHEIAHAVANHGSERMSQGLLVQMGGIGLALALSQHPEATQSLWMSAYGATSQVGLMLPYSRLHESEADRMGLIFMAMAGYDPHAAVKFWQRMAANKEGKAGMEFLSTHPSDRTRIENIKKLIPEAMRYYRAG
jgi:predicted Zn-dependent protease